MCLNHHRRCQTGSSLLIAVFVMVVMSAMALILMDNLRQEDSNLSLDVNHGRAITVAETGIEWGLARVFNRGAESVSAACTGVESALLQIGSGLPDVTGLRACQVTLGCELGNAALADDVSSRIKIIATGTCGSGRYQASHRLEVLAYE